MSRLPQFRNVLRHERGPLQLSDAPEGTRLRDRATRIGRQKLSAPQPGGRSLDSSKTEAAYVGFHKTFNDRFSRAGRGLHRRIATVVETTDLVDRQVWLTSNPKLRDWNGDKVLHKYRSESHPIVTTPKEASVEVPKYDIMHDKLGLYRPRINSLADAYWDGLDELAIVMVAAGIAGTSLGTTYDGQNLIDTDHTTLSVGGTSQSNKVTGALSATTLATARRRFLEFKDEFGRPIMTAGRRKTLFAGPAWEDTILDILVAKTVSTGGENVDANSMNYVITEWLSAGTVVINGVSVTLTGLEWFIVAEDSAAILIHLMHAPEFLSVEDGAFVFTSGKYLYGIECQFGAAYGLWQEIVGGPGS